MIYLDTFKNKNLIKYFNTMVLISKILKNVDFFFNFFQLFISEYGCIVFSSV